MISIVMPTHRNMPLLYATLMSVFCQDFDDFEFVVVDASDDAYFENECLSLFDKVDSLSRVRHKLQKMKIVRATEKRTFPGAMKMLGFKNCRQDDDFVFFLDHDDLIGENILRYMRLAQIQYPSTEMISTNYSNFLYINGNVYSSRGEFMGGIRCGDTIRVNFGDMYFSFQEPLGVYRWSHPFLSCDCPKILSKGTVRDRRYAFIEDTEIMDDSAYDLITHSLEETYIPSIGYYYVGYNSDNVSTTSYCGKEPSKTAILYRDITNKYMELLNLMQYKKKRNICAI